MDMSLTNSGPCQALMHETKKFDDDMIKLSRVTSLVGSAQEFKFQIDAAACPRRFYPFSFHESLKS
jgi:hypothetical protein